MDFIMVYLIRLKWLALYKQNFSYEYIIVKPWNKMRIAIKKNSVRTPKQKGNEEWIISERACNDTYPRKLPKIRMMHH